MEAGGETPKTPKKTPKTKIKNKTQKPNKLILTPQLISLLSSAASAAHAFLVLNETQLRPSQIVAVESLLSSLSSLYPSSPSPLPNFPFLNSDDQWRILFRMSQQTFNHLLSLLSPLISSSLPSISPSSALAAALFRLAHGASYKSVARRFGFPSSADACRVFYTVCKAINDDLGNKVDMEEELGRIMVGFGWMSLPNCCGVLGFGKFDVQSEILGGENGSLLVQALVDTEGRFLDISAGWPCTMNPQSILHQSKIFTNVEESRAFLNGPAYELSNGSLIPQYILGDASLPLLPWLITPYCRNDEEDSFSSAEKEFNLVHSRTIGLVDAAFGRVKERWKLLGRKWKEECLEFMPFVIVSGCLLHNFLIKLNEPNIPGDGTPYCRVPVFQGQGEREGEGEDEKAMMIRDALAHHLIKVSLRR